MIRQSAKLNTLTVILHISFGNLTMQFGMPIGNNGLVTQHRLQWLGHMVRMNNDRLLKQLLFGELLPTRPTHGPKLR